MISYNALFLGLSHVFCRSLPHGIRSDLADVCLFTKDEPNLSSEQTERYYKKLLNNHGIKTISQVGSRLIFSRQLKFGFS